MDEKPLVSLSERTLAGNRIDYGVTIHGGLALVPEGNAIDALRVDYQRMVADGLLLDEAENFEELMEKCQAIQHRVNAAFEDDEKS